MDREASKDDVFDAFADGYRRQLLVELAENEWQSVAKLTGVSEELAEAHESLLRNHLHESLDTVDVDERLLRVHLVHLPKLEEYGFIDWHRNSQIVTQGRRFDQLRPYLEMLDDSQRERGTREASELTSQ